MAAKPIFPEPTVHELHSPHLGPHSNVSLSVHQLDGRTESTVQDQPVVVFCHGFPELAYSWRHQLEEVANAGFLVVAPDQRGYGKSDRPEAIDAYGIDYLCGDLAALVNDVGAKSAIFVGHDWGGFVAWAMPLLYPELTAGVVGLCTPYTPFPTTSFLKEMFGEDPETMYMLWFQDPPIAEDFLNARVPTLVDKLFVRGFDPEIAKSLGVARRAGFSFNPFLSIDTMGDAGEAVLSSAERDVYIDTFEATGFQGGINWYRNIDANAARHPGIGNDAIDIPTLMMSAEWDLALPPALAKSMPERCSDLEYHIIEKAGHWLQQESPDEVNSILVEWLVRKFQT